MADFQLNSFQTDKTILPNFRFQGEFIKGEKWTGGELSNIKPWHIRAISYENMTFKQEGQYHGPGILKTFPVLDRGEAGAYILRVTLEEDKEGNILKFIELLKAQIINSDGIYKSIDDIKKSLQFNLTILTTPEIIIQFQELYYLNAESTEYSYGDADMKTYTISLAYDNYKIIKS